MQPKVYFVLAEELDRVKIGVSVDVASRIRQMETGCQCALRLLGAVYGSHQLERQLHRDFSKHRVLGEWFQYQPLKAVIQEILSSETKAA